MSLTIKILGSGCPNCKRLEAETQAVLDGTAISYHIEKVTDFAEIASYGIMSTPGLVINETVYSYGRIPKRREILDWVQSVEEV